MVIVQGYLSPLAVTQGYTSLDLPTAPHAIYNISATGVLTRPRP